MTWCLIGDIRVLSAFDTCFDTLAIFPACTAFLPVPHRENSLSGRPLSRMVTSRGDFGFREIGVLANLKAVSMCFMTFTKSSSGLSGCQCCMICIEHVFHSPKEGHVLFQMCPNCFPCFGSLPVREATASALWPSPAISGRLPLKGTHEGFLFFSNAHKHPVITVVMFTLLNSQEAPRARSLDRCSSIPLYYLSILNSNESFTIWVNINFC